MKYNYNTILSGKNLDKFADQIQQALEPFAHTGLDAFWNVLEHPEFPFVTLTSTTNGQRNFPPYNIIQSKDGKVRLELAVAGFTKDRLKVEIEGNILIIQGTPAKEVQDETIRHRGISNAAFLRTFEMKPGTLIESVTFVDGILNVVVYSQKPEQKARTSFEIK